MVPPSQGSLAAFISCDPQVMSQNHRTVGVGRGLCGSSSPTTLLKQGHLEQLHKAWSRWVLNGGDSRMLLGSLFQCSVTLRVKKFFLMFR